MKLNQVHVHYRQPGSAPTTEKWWWMGEGETYETPSGGYAVHVCSIHESEQSAMFLGVPEPFAGVYNKTEKDAFTHSHNATIGVKRNKDHIWRLQRDGEWIGRLLPQGGVEGPFVFGWWFRLTQQSFRSGWLLGPSGFAKARIQVGLPGRSFWII